MTTRHLSRRTFLRGLGTAMALPWLESMAPATAMAGTAAQAPPLRMAFFFVPNGIRMSEWTPSRVGSDFELPYILEPLHKVKDQLMVLSGLTHDKGRANSDGPGDHARAAATYLTGAQAYKTPGAKFRVGVSVDQLAAQTIGSATRFASLELGCDRGGNSGQCDSGYSCAYSNNISWRTDTTPAAKEIDPRALFDRLYGNDSKREMAQSRGERDRFRKSILDFVLDDAKRLQPVLGKTDQQKLEEYLTGVREIEQRMERSETVVEKAPSGFERPTGVPKDFRDHTHLMDDLLALAFRTDQTRIATFMMARAGSNRSYPWVEVNEGHHELSHHQGSKVKHEKLKRIDRFHVERFAYFLEKLQSMPEGDGTVLDNCMIMYGSGISDGNRHNNEDLPIILAGGGRGTLQTGRHIKFRRETPVANLFLSMLDRMGVSTDTFGDSTGRLPFLT